MLHVAAYMQSYKMLDLVVDDFRVSFNYLSVIVHFFFLVVVYATI